MIDRRGIVTLVGAAVLATNAAGCVRDQPSPEPESHSVAPAVTHENGGRIRLDEEGVRRAGVQTAVVARAAGRMQVDAFGRVLDPLPLIEALQVRAAAIAAVTAARAEYERVARLHRADQNASTRDLETARATLDKATADLNTATARLTLGWGAAAAVSAAVVDDLGAGRSALVRIDLPAGSVLAVPPNTVTVGGTRACVLGRAPTVDPLVQGESWFALLEGDPPRPGALLPVVAARAPEPMVGVGVPMAAIVWVDGQPALYAEPVAGEFERRTVTLGPRAEAGPRGDDAPRADEAWIVTTGLAPGERVVVAGAGRLRSVEVMHAGPDQD